ncbi:MAG: hypothetical protein ABMB14_10575 [Myxococcota bacterium]
MAVSAPEARNTWESVNRLTTDLVLESLEAVLGGDSSLTFHRNGDLRLTGALDGGDWSGDVEVDGAVTSTRDQYGYTVEVDLSGVAVDDRRRTELDGSIGFAFTADDTIDLADLSYTAGVSVDGALDLTGADEGHAELAYDLVLELHGLAVSATATGAISGHDVSDWDQVLSLLF